MLSSFRPSGGGRNNWSHRCGEQAIAAELDLDKLLPKLVELTRERFGYYHVQISLVEDEEHRAVSRASTGHDLNKLWLKEGRSQRFFKGIIGWVAATGDICWQAT